MDGQRFLEASELLFLQVGPNMIAVALAVAVAVAVAVTVPV